MWFKRHRMGKDLEKPEERTWVPADEWTSIQGRVEENERQKKARARLGQAFYQANPEIPEDQSLDAVYAIVGAGCDTDEAIQMIRNGSTTNDIIEKLKKNESKLGVGRDRSP